MSVEIWAVTATSRPDGTAATNTQRLIVGHDGFGVAGTSWTVCAFAGARSSSAPQAAISAVSSAKPTLHSRLCVCTAKIGSSRIGYDSSARKLPMLDAA